MTEQVFSQVRFLLAFPRWSGRGNAESSSNCCFGTLEIRIAFFSCVRSSFLTDHKIISVKQFQSLILLLGNSATVLFSYMENLSQSKFKVLFFSIYPLPKWCSPRQSSHAVFSDSHKFFSIVLVSWLQKQLFPTAIGYQSQVPTQLEPA